MPQAEITVKLLQRCVIWWLWKHDKTAQDIFLELTAVFMEETYSKDAVRYWLKEYNSGRDQIQDLHRTGRPCSARTENNVQDVLECVTSDHRSTVDQMAYQLQISHTTVQRILKKDLQLKKKAAKYVPRLLTDHHKQQRVDSCMENMLWKRRELDLFQHVITGDESYFHLYMPETKEQSK